MTIVYTYTEARQDLASLLDRAVEDGEVRVKRRDGQVFSIRPLVTSKSPLDVQPVDLGLTTEEILEFIAESRRPA